MIGSANYQCDSCGKVEKIALADYIDEAGPPRKLEDEGWVFLRVHGAWRDFCSEECAERYFSR